MNINLRRLSSLEENQVSGGLGIRKYFKIIRGKGKFDTKVLRCGGVKKFPGEPVEIGEKKDDKN